MRLIDADAYKHILEGWLSEMHQGEDEQENTEGQAIYGCICQLDDAQTVDAVEVVRCQDCKYRHGAFCPTIHETMGNGLVEYTSDDDYCSRGKRKMDTKED